VILWIAVYFFPPRSGRLNLARPFKAGISAITSNVVALATAENIPQSSLTRRHLLASSIPALKGRAKFSRR
jgi:hypothetical protein